MKRSGYIQIVLFAMSLALMTCDAKGPLPSPDVISPTISFTIPANGSVNIPVNLSGITITFSEAMDRSTINDQTITLVDSSVSGTVPGSVTITDLAGTTVDLIPSVSLNPTTLYRIVVGVGVKDKYGNALTAPFTASFYTAATADTTPPVAASTYPAAGETGVPINSSPRVTFSEQVIPQTIAFVLTLGTTTVPGTVSYSGSTAVFAPANVLAANALYTARITGGVTGVRDLAGNFLSADHAWTFTTAQDAATPFVTATTPVAGGSNIGVNAAISVTFSEPVDQASIAFSLAAGGPPVAGSLTYSGTTAIFTPQQILAYSTQYTATVSAGLRDLAGNTMTADHVWTFTTSIAPDATPPFVTATTPAAGSSDVGTNGALSFTFSEPVDEATIPFALTAGGVPVSGSLTYSGTTAIFTPSGPLNYSTLYTGKVSSGVQDLAGNAMQADYFWSFTTGTAPDATEPFVIATTPAAGASTVGVNAAVSVTFSEPVDQTSITFSLTAGGPPVAGSLTYSGTTAIFTPQNVLAYSTQYTATVSAGLRDLANNAMTADYGWTFTTGIAPDRTPPFVTATSPAAGSTDVGINGALSFTFSEPVDEATIPFALTAGGPPVAGSLTYSGTTAIFTPSGPLNYSTLYTGKVSSGVKDLAGNAMHADYFWSFTTGTAPDITAPTVVATTPADGAVNVPPYGALSATFSEPIDQASIVFLLTDGSTSLPCTMTYTGTTAIFTPSSMLAAGTTYTATVAAGVKDLADNAMTADALWTFTTQ